MISVAVCGDLTAHKINSEAAHAQSSLSDSKSSCQATGAEEANMSSDIMVAPLMRVARGAW